MNSDRWERVQDLLNEALGRDSDERNVFLERECGTDDELLREVESLLEAHKKLGPLDDLSQKVVTPLVSRLRDPTTLQGERVEHYKIGERLGGGGMGVVFRARDTRNDQSVAIKFLLPHLSADETAKQRFKNEARAVAALRHPNIRPIYDVGEAAQGWLFMTMPLYEGETIHAKLKRGVLALKDAVDVALQVSRGLATAHNKQIVHRDIKPANVFVTHDRTVKILDFGIAKLADAKLTATGVAVGTLAYMSPEQARGKRVDARTDIWSLGVMLYKMLTGVLPFRGEDSQAVLHRILNEEPTPITTERSELPGSLNRVLTKALAKDVAARYENVELFASDLSGIAL